MCGSKFTNVFFIVAVAAVICGPSSTWANPNNEVTININGLEENEDGNYVININLGDHVGGGQQGGTVTFYRHINYDNNSEDMYLPPGSCVSFASLNNDARSVKMHSVNCIQLFDEVNCEGPSKITHSDTVDFGDWRDKPSSVRLCGSGLAHQAGGQVVLYRMTSFTDREEEVTVSSSCTNLNSLNNDSRSIRLNGMTCVRLFDDPNCTGANLIVMPGVHDSDFGEFKDKPSSIRLC